MSSGPESSVKSESQATSSLFGTTGGSDELLTCATSGSRTSRDSSSGSSRFSWGRDAGGHMPVVPMAMTDRTIGGDTAVGPAVAMYVTQETLPSNPVEEDQDDVTMSESNRSQPGDGRRSLPDVSPSAQVRRRPVAQAAKRVTDAAGPVDAPRPSAPTAQGDHVPPQVLGAHKLP
ncbi:unnamed protein product [Phytophthora fragariaefolia]|uniref:Unnamed protein product n=1 Tax=Phytophthora fragariaefolia TaxID=1490495 RepID=A0A9W6UAK4_9STRA|nr:unnamed protein product [Phytophthora fragariaefolia]